MFQTGMPRKAEPTQPSAARQLQVYTDVLNQLVEQRWNDRYLGPDERRISQVRTDAYLHHADTTGLQREVNRLRQNLMQQPERQSAVCLQAEFRPFLPPWSYFQGEGVLTPIGGRLMGMLQSVAGAAVRTALDSLRTGQRQLRAANLRLRTARVQSAPTPAPGSSANKEWYLKPCSIGMVSLSRLVFNTSKTKCLLAYNFYCGGKCGQGELLVAEKRGGRWVIVAAEECWVS
ncbi:hypothetical protein B0919_08475 [Hymenobacter sp. CRA2]|nr:hypothetical protein B0919_08475 [Hymenobacter sp. CRA2]